MAEIPMEHTLLIRWQTAQAITAGIIQDAANAIATLRQQNEKLQAELEALKEDLAHIRSECMLDEELQSEENL